MAKRTIILTSHDRELTVDIVVEPLSKTIHVKVEWIDTQFLTELVRDELSRLDDEYKVWLHTINRGVEIDSNVVDGKQSVILPQVTFGIAVRMAVMSIVAGNEA